MKYNVKFSSIIDVEVKKDVVLIVSKFNEYNLKEFIKMNMKSMNNNGGLFNSLNESTFKIITEPKLSLKMIKTLRFFPVSMIV